MKNKLLTGLISVGIALAVWIYVVTVVSPNSDKSIHNIPVVTQGEALLLDRGLMITGTDTTTTSLHLEGNRIDLNKLSSSNITVTMDVSRIYETGVHDLTFDVTYLAGVAPNAVTVLSKNPGVIRVTVEERVSKTVPVEIKYNGTLSEDFVADKENIELDVDEILVTGPKSTVDQITKAVIVLDLAGRSESISDKFVYTLCNSAGEPVDAKLVNTDVAEVNVTLRITRVKEISLTVNVIDGGGATAATSMITIDPPTILISGSDTLLAGLNSLELGTIDLKMVSAGTTQQFPIKLPEGIANETGVTEATVTITLPELETKTFTVRNITAVNVPQNMQVTFITKALEVTVRGPKAKIEKLSENEIAATVDFTNAEAGTVKLKPQFDCGDPQVGAIGPYNTVSATVKNA